LQSRTSNFPVAPELPIDLGPIGTDSDLRLLAPDVRGDALLGSPSAFIPSLNEETH
jgi:hypothetical protein